MLNKVRNLQRHDLLMKTAWLILTVTVMLTQIHAVRAQTPPPNDNFADRLVLPGSSVTFTGTTANATVEVDEPGYYASTYSTVWWSWTAPTNSFVSFNVISVTGTPPCMLAIFTGTNVESLHLVAESHEINQFYDFLLFWTWFNAVGGNTYHIRMGNWQWPGSNTVVLKLIATNAPVVVSHPQSITVEENDSGLFTVAAFAHGLRYQWRHNSTNLPGETRPALILRNVAASQSGPYDAVLSDGTGTNFYQSATTMVATLTVNPPSVPARLHVLGSANSNRLAFDLHGASSRIYALEVSTNLLNWRFFNHVDPNVTVTNPVIPFDNKNFFDGTVITMPAVKSREFLRPWRYSDHRQDCVNTLKAFHFAKEQWAIGNFKSSTDMPAVSDLIGIDRYIHFDTGMMPSCPLNGMYTLGTMSARPTCSVAGHTLE